jgi:hypothetical protein
MPGGCQILFLETFSIRVTVGLNLLNLKYIQFSFRVHTGTILSGIH